jgi:hypothetical protein
LTGAGSAKSGLQNLERQGFRGQNIDNKGLAAFPAAVACTAFASATFAATILASTIIGSFGASGKVGRHTPGLWKFTERRRGVEGLERFERF